MFFTRKPPKCVARTAPAPAVPSSNSSANDATTLLDALDGVLQSFARFPLATESLDAESATAKITDWMRHATTGTKHPPRAARA